MNTKIIPKAKYISLCPQVVFLNRIPFNNNKRDIISNIISIISNFGIIDYFVDFVTNMFSPDFSSWFFLFRRRSQFQFLIPLSCKRLFRLLRHIILRLLKKRIVQDMLIELIIPSPMYLIQSNKIFFYRKALIIWIVKYLRLTLPKQKLMLQENDLYYWIC